MPDKIEGETKMAQKIELDTRPFAPRPDTFIAFVLENTGLPDRTVSSARFGTWTWDYSDIAPSLWQKAVPIIKQRICDLFANDNIRYGAWE